jgi:sugar lactone lactonase YvrE
MITLLFGLACTATGPETTLDSGTTDSGTSEPWCASHDGDEFATLVACYGILNTIAGIGTTGTKGYNGWQTSFEGGDALEAELSRPHMTMADAAGNLYIADKDAHAIRKVDLDGIITTIAGTGIAGDDGDEPGPGPEHALSSPNGLWVSPDGTVYIHDMGNDKIRRLDTDGVLTTLFETPESSTGRGLWVAEDESQAYVSCGSNIQSWTPDGGTKTLASGFSSLGNLVVDPDGFVVATDRGGHTVTRVEPDGSKERIAGNGSTIGGGDGELALETGLSEVRGIWFHPLGGYFLATHGGGQIWYVDTDGIIHLFVAGDQDHSHSGDGERFDTEGKKISEPRAITMDDKGRLLITENDAGFVRRIERAE